MRTKLIKASVGRELKFHAFKVSYVGKSSVYSNSFLWFTFESNEGRFNFMVIGFLFLFVEETFQFMCVDFVLSLRLLLYSLIIQGVKRFMAMLNEHFLRLFNLYRWAGTHKLLSLGFGMCLLSQIKCVSAFSANRAPFFPTKWVQIVKEIDMIH